MAAPNFSTTPYSPDLHGPLIGLSAEEKQEIASLRCTNDTPPAGMDLDLFITQDIRLMHRQHSVIPTAKRTAWQVVGADTENRASDAFIQHLRIVLGLTAGHSAANAEGSGCQYLWTAQRGPHLLHAFDTHARDPPNSTPPPQPQPTAVAAFPPHGAIITTREGVPLQNTPADGAAAHLAFQAAERDFVRDAAYPPQGNLARIANQSWIRDMASVVLPKISAWYRGDTRPIHQVIFGSLHQALAKEELLFTKKDDHDWLRQLRADCQAKTKSKRPWFTVCARLWGLAAAIRPPYELRLIGQARALFEVTALLQPTASDKVRFLAEVLDEMYNHSAVVGNNLFVHLDWHWLVQRLTSQLHTQRQQTMAIHGSAEPQPATKRPVRTAENPVAKMAPLPQALRDQIKANNLCIRYHMGIPHQCPPGRKCGVHIWDLLNPPTNAPTASTPAAAYKAAATSIGASKG